MNFHDFDFWWRERGDVEQLTQMRAQLEKPLLHKPPRDIEYSILWRLARLEHFTALVKIEDSERKTAHHHFVLGEIHAHRATQLRDEAAGNFWLGVCRLEAARARHKFAVWKVLKSARHHLQMAFERDEAFHFAGAFRVLARIEALAPFPFGSKKRALNFTNRALKIAPHNSTTLLYKAELLKSMELKLEARGILQEIVSQPLDDEWKWEQARDKVIAARLLDENELGA